jgi:hypothetical protein
MSPRVGDSSLVPPLHNLYPNSMEQQLEIQSLYEPRGSLEAWGLHGSEVQVAVFLGCGAV